LARASDHFRQSDVTFWGLVALATAAIAVVSSNVSAIAPRSVINALHSPRTNLTSVDGLREQVSTLQTDMGKLNRDYQSLQSLTQIQDKSGKEIVRRVSALEVTIPKIIETIPYSTVDVSNLTASIDAPADTIEVAALGGSASVRHSPLPGAQPIPVTVPQALPEPINAGSVAAQPNPIPYGVAIGGFVAPQTAESTWRDLQMKLGPLLLEFSPVLSAPTEQGSRILVGPMETLAEARQMCERLERIAFSCLPVSYEGRQLFAQEPN
jgi:hypothetical protein